MRKASQSSRESLVGQIPAQVNNASCVASAKRRVAKRGIAAVAATLCVAVLSADTSHGPSDEFLVQVLTSGRADAPGISTVVVAGEQRFVFDCGMTQVEWLSAAVADPVPVAALFLTQLGPLTSAGLDRLLTYRTTEPDAGLPFRIWGPPGTSDRLRRFANHGVTTGAGEPFTPIDVREGVLSESGGLLVTAIELADTKFAYRVSYHRHSVLIATDATFSPHLARLSRGLDVAVIRHSEGAEAARILDTVQPRLAVLSRDGTSTTTAQLRQRYAGPLHVVDEGTLTIDVFQGTAVPNASIARQ